jgi:2-dehydro-3-deoxyphosphogluconate aldolase/(4S)-4-hydroxy-2-oxoglutarate aldolase
MNAEKTLATIYEKKIIAIVRKIPPDSMEMLMRALLEGGVCCIEVTFDHETSRGHAQTLESIARLKKAFGDSILLGAGTVLAARDVQLAVEAGAGFILSPNTDAAVIGETKRQRAVSIPGAYTPTEILRAWQLGADIVKLFPASIGGIAYLRAVRGPLPHIPLAAVGGVNADNIADFLAAGARCAGVGGNLAGAAWALSREFGKITQAAREYTEKLK